MHSARVLVTGGTGLLGKALLDAAPSGWRVVATAHRTCPPVEWAHRFTPLDLEDRAAIARVIDEVDPTVVIHAASIGSVDEAERHPEAVRRVNVGGTQAIGEACARHGAQLVFISSNAVFDGRHPPYAEDAPLQALNRYGALKIEAETWVRTQSIPHLIIRPILMYGWPFPGGRDNAMTRWLSQLERGHPFDVAEDIYSMPLLATNAAEAVWAAIGRGRSGTYHVAGADRVSLVEFARAVAQVFGHDERLIRPVPGASMAGLAPRPHDTSFVTTKMQQDLAVHPIGIREGLASLLRTRAAAV